MDIQKNRVLFTKKTSAWYKGIAIIMVILSHYAEWWSLFCEEEGTREMIRYGISRLGPYGVAVFLLFSGYGLSKSAGEKRIGLKFILKRVISVYIPYLIMAFLIEMLSGSSLGDLSADFWSGGDFWYMTVMFVLYLAFMAIWFLFQNRHIRAIAIAAVVYIYSNGLYQRGERDFWYISNIAFVIGVWMALYENEILNVKLIIRMISTFISGICFSYAAYLSISDRYNPKSVWTDAGGGMQCRILAVILFALFVVCLASTWKYSDPVGTFLGKYSLYYYLLHTFLFMWTINHYDFDIKLRFVAATVVIVTVSAVLGMTITKLTDIFYQKVQYLVDFKPKKG